MKHLFLISLIIFGLIFCGFRLFIDNVSAQDNYFLIKNIDDWNRAGFNGTVFPLYETECLIDFYLPIALKKTFIPNIKISDLNYRFIGTNKNFSDRFISVDYQIKISDDYYVVIFHAKSKADNTTFNVDFIPKIKNYEFPEFAWYNSNWKMKKKITIQYNQVKDTLVNYPMLFKYTSTDFRDNAKTNGYDFVFTDSTETVKFNHEIERYNNAIGELIAWVNITKIRHNVDTIIYVYFNNSASSNQQNINSTWDSNYVTVLHCNQSTGNLQDVTSTALSWVDASVVNTRYQQTGKIGYCVGGDDTNVYFTNSVLSVTSYSQMTIECFYNSESFSNANIDYLFASRWDSTPNDVRFIYRHGTGGSTTGYDCMWDDGTDEGGADNTYTYCNGFIYYATTIVNNNHVYGYRNATRTITDSSVSFDFTIADNVHCIGARSYAVTKSPFKGFIDEFRLSKIERNSSWLITTYNNVYNATAGGFYIVGGIEYYDNVPPTQNYNKTQIVIRWNIDLFDNSNVFDYNISCSDGNYTTGNNVPNGTYWIDLYNLSLNTTYTITVKVNDNANNWNNNTYNLNVTKWLNFIPTINKYENIVNATGTHNSDYNITTDTVRIWANYTGNQSAGIIWVNYTDSNVTFNVSVNKITGANTSTYSINLTNWLFIGVGSVMDVVFSFGSEAIVLIVWILFVLAILFSKNKFVYFISGLFIFAEILLVIPLISSTIIQIFVLASFLFGILGIIRFYTALKSEKIE